MNMHLWDRNTLQNPFSVSDDSFCFSKVKSPPSLTYARKYRRMEEKKDLALRAINRMKNLVRIRHDREQEAEQEAVWIHMKYSRFPFFFLYLCLSFVGSLFLLSFFDLDILIVVHWMNSFLHLIPLLLGSVLSAYVYSSTAKEIRRGTQSSCWSRFVFRFSCQKVLQASYEWDSLE